MTTEMCQYRWSLELKISLLNWLLGCLEFDWSVFRTLIKYRRKIIKLTSGQVYVTYPNPPFSRTKSGILTKNEDFHEFQGTRKLILGLRQRWSWFLSVFLSPKGLVRWFDSRGYLWSQGEVRGSSYEVGKSPQWGSSRSGDHEKSGSGRGNWRQKCVNTAGA